MEGEGGRDGGCETEIESNEMERERGRERERERKNGRDEVGSTKGRRTTNRADSAHLRHHAGGSCIGQSERSTPEAACDVRGGYSGDA